MAQRPVPKTGGSGSKQAAQAKADLYEDRNNNIMIMRQSRRSIIWCLVPRLHIGSTSVVQDAVFSVYVIAR
ncbi:hypothetical protein N7456_011876 [Penicillium angulare]|uniref:Uncharacterized protein n=1 Tax=Penicillium angulare TaxID=116970 RepID=A0A9W9K0H8_9EURO|nr:hypothetical protein N7456_011876 [Penicillium angulare]